MEDYFKGFSNDIFFLNYNNKGSTTTSITKWDIIRKLTKKIGIDEEPADSHKSEPGVQLLPRQDVMLYGTIPKMEQRTYSKCKECRLVFNPRDILSHKNCSSKSSHHSHQSILKKKVKSKSSSSKKTHSAGTVPSSPPSIFKKPPSPTTTSFNILPELKVSVTKVILPKVSKVKTVTALSTATTSTTLSDKHEVRVSASASKVTSSVSSPRSPSKTSSSHSHSSKVSSKSTSIETSGATTSHSSSSTNTGSTSSNSSSSSSSSSSSRHKKSKRSNTSSSSSNSSKVLAKECDPDSQCETVEGSRGPCTRSNTCSNRRIQLRKLLKDIHQLIAERKAAKEKDLKHSSAPCSYTPPNGEEKEMFCQNTSYVPIVAKIVSTTIESTPVTTSYVPIMPKVSTNSRLSTTSILSTKKSGVESDIESSKALTNGFIGHSQNFESTSQDSAVGTVPVVYMPMSPISVVSPVQFVKIGNNMLCLESPQSAMSPPVKNKSLFLPMPNHSNNSNIKMYKSHPKPIVLPNFGTRKIGGAILLANPRLESQRNELLTALNSKQKTVNNNRAISLLNHGNSPHRPNILKVKSGTKTNCKRPAIDKLVTSDSKRLVPDANGFILHADVSETADAPQSNNCIQEKIALLNMK